MLGQTVIRTATAHWSSVMVGMQVEPTATITMRWANWTGKEPDRSSDSSREPMGFLGSSIKLNYVTPTSILTKACIFYFQSLIAVGFNILSNILNIFYSKILHNKLISEPVVDLIYRKQYKLRIMDTNTKYFRKPIY